MKRHLNVREWDWPLVTLWSRELKAVWLTGDDPVTTMTESPS